MNRKDRNPDYSAQRQFGSTLLALLLNVAIVYGLCCDQTQAQQYLRSHAPSSSTCAGNVSPFHQLQRG